MNCYWDEQFQDYNVVTSFAREAMKPKWTVEFREKNNPAARWKSAGTKLIFGSQEEAQAHCVEHDSKSWEFRPVSYIREEATHHDD